MKKFFLMLLVAAFSLTAGAQVYLGGEVGLWRNSDDNHTAFKLKPEIGYNLSDKWALGIGIGYNHDYVGTGDVELPGFDASGSVKVNGFSVTPYARYSFAKFGPVSLFLDGGFGINTYKVKVTGEVGDHSASKTSDAQTGWQIGIQPGVKVNLAKNIDFIARVGFLGYRDADDQYCQFGENGFGFDLSNNLSFGLFYNF